MPDEGAPSRLLPTLALLLLGASARAEPGAALPAGTAPAQWRVIWHEDPAHAAVVAWSTDQAGPSTLFVDTATRGPDVAAYARKVSCESALYTFSLDHAHRCALDGLEPSTR